MNKATDPAALLDSALIDALGPECLQGEDAKALFSTDVYGEGIAPALVVRPQSQEQVADAVRLIGARVKELVAKGQLEMSDEVARGEPTRIIQEALRHFGSYHRGGVISRRGDRLFPSDMNLVYYYHNRLSGYGLESALDRSHSS